MDNDKWDDYEEETFLEENKDSFEGVPPWISGEGIFQQSFRQRLLDVGQDVEQEWPELRDDENLQLFRTLKKGLRTSYATDPKVLEELLGIYTTCLSYMHQFPHKRDPEHRECMRSVLKSDLRPILFSLWHQQFKLIFPFGEEPLNHSLLLATSKFASAIFKLYHKNRTFEYAAPGLTDLCDNSPLITIITHTLFFAGSDETRRLAYAGLEIALDIDATTGAQKGSKPYFRKLRKSHVRQQIQIILHNDTIADDGLLYVLNQYGHIAEADLPEELREIALTRSFAVLERQCSGKIATTLDHDTNLLAMEVPNIILKVNLKASTSPIVALQEVIAKLDAFKLMASAALFFARTFDWLQWSLKWNSQPISKLQSSFVEEDVRQKDRKACYSRMFLLPVILGQMQKAKTWTPEHHAFVSNLGERGRTVWKQTLDDLRALEQSKDIPEFHMVPSVILGWNELGTLIGVHQLLDSVIGCCYADCPNFLVATDQKIGRCTGCKKVLYCTPKCQTSDWKTHKPHCVPKSVDQN